MPIRFLYLYLNAIFNANCLQTVTDFLLHWHICFFLKLTHCVTSFPPWPINFLPLQWPETCMQNQAEAKWKLYQQKDTVPHSLRVKWETSVWRKLVSDLENRKYTVIASHKKHFQCNPRADASVFPWENFFLEGWKKPFRGKQSPIKTEFVFQEIPVHADVRCFQCDLKWTLASYCTISFCAFLLLK